MAIQKPNTYFERHIITMSTATETTSNAVTTAAKKAAVAASAVSEALPTVVATEELTASLEVPTKVVLNQGLVVVASFAAGIAVAAGGVFGWKKYQEYKGKKQVEKALNEAATSSPATNIKKSSTDK